MWPIYIEALDRDRNRGQGRGNGGSSLHFDMRLLRNMDKLLLLTMFALIAIGVVVISSAARGFEGGGDPSGYIQKQIIAGALGLVGLLVLLIFDYGEFGRMWKVIYGINVGLLLLVLVVGRVTKGSQRWIHLGPLNVEPSEYAKIFVIITLGYLLSRMDRLDSVWDLIIPILHVLPVVGLILVQPDLGTSVILVVISASLVYMAGFSGWKMLLLGGGPIAAFSFWIYAHLKWGVSMWLMDEYQVNRILDFLDPSRDPLGTGWQVRQSKIAIGSGGLFGKGLGEGTQSQFGFVPDQHTDFIFSVVGEELGLIGGAVILLLFLMLLWRIMVIASTAKDLYGSLLATGVAVKIGFHVVQNVGMTLGLMPVTGITLPFISYGGTSLMTNVIAIGLVLNVGMRRQTLMF